MNTFHTLQSRSLFNFSWLLCLFIVAQTCNSFGQLKVDRVVLRPDGKVELSFQTNAGRYYRLLSGTVVDSIKTPVAVSFLPPLIAPPSDAPFRFLQLQGISLSAALDSDGDGRDDVAEMLAGTNPLQVDEAIPTVTSIISSPAHGENEVAVTRETVLRFSQPLAAATEITTANFFAEFGGRKLLSRVEISSDRRKATLFYLENLPGASRVRVTLNPNRILDSGGKAVDGDGDGQPGGVALIDFDTLSTTALPRTGVIGRVFASELVPGPVNGSVNVPLKGVTITVDGAEESLRTTTDANGNFKLEPAPAGRFFVHVDGRTAEGSEWPNGPYYPFVGKAWESLPGKLDNLAGVTGEIYLPRVSGNTLKPVSLVADTTITFPPEAIAANPALEGVSLTIPANSLFADNGVRGGRRQAICLRNSSALRGKT